MLPICHILLHLGALKVSGVPGVNLRWERNVKGMDLELRTEREELRSIPVVAVPAGGGRPSGIPDRDLAVQALRSLRYTKGEAEKRVAAAGAALEREGQPVKLEELIRRALRGR